MGARVRLGPKHAIPENDFRVFQLDAIDVVVYNVMGKFYGVGNYCPHAGVALSRGPLDGTIITCPGHGLRFDVVTGDCLDMEFLKLTRFEIEVVGDDLYVTF